MALKQKRVRFGKYMGLGWACAAIAFLFNPDIALVDILPDFIGYIFLTLSLLYFRDLSPHFESAWKRFRWLCVVSAFKFGAFIWVFGGLDNQQEKPTMMLLCSFCFCVGELILGIPAWKELIEGFVIHAQTAGGEFPLREKISRAGRAGKNVSVSFRNITVFFICAKAFFANISEFAVLSEHSYDDTAFKWYDFIGLFRILALAAGMAAGLIWLVNAIRYFRGLVSDGEFIDSAKRKYETTVIPNTYLFLKRDIAFTIGLFCLAALATPDFYLDYINIIPDTLTALFLLWGFIKLKPYFKHHKAGIALSAVYGAISIWGAAVSYNYTSDPISIHRTWENPKVYAMFWSMYPIRIIEAVLFLAATVLALVAVRAIIKDYCGYVPSNMDEAYRNARLAAIQKEVGNKVTLCLVFGVLTMLTGGLYELILSLNMLISELWAIINFIVSGCFFASSLYMMNAVCEEVESRYMLD